MEKVLKKEKGSLYAGMGELVMGQDEEDLVCLGLGSCIALVLYSHRDRVAVMAHIMLPNCPKGNKGGPSKPGKFADRAVPEMLAMLRKEGVPEEVLRAKLAGGSRMFAFSNSSGMAIGEQNIARVTRLLEEYHIPIDASETGGSRGRSVTFHTRDCSLEVRVIGEGTRIL